MSLIDSLSKDEIIETPMIDIMYHYLFDEKQPVNFYTLMDKIAEYKNWSAREKKSRLVQAYTDMNIDGRFVALGDNQWGLKSWYPVEQTDEELATTIKPTKKKKKKKVKEDDFDDYNDVELLDLDEEDLDEEDEDEDVDGDVDEVEGELVDLEEIVDDEEKVVDEDFDEEEEFDEEEDEEEK